MLPQFHFLLGIIFVAILYFFFSPIISLFGLAVILLSSVLIDIDHYVYYVYKKKDLNPFKAHKWYLKNIKKFHSMSKEQKKKFYIGFYFFHGIESLIILLFLGFYISPIFIFIFIGFFFHLSIDFIADIILEERFGKISVIYTLISLKKLVHIEEVKNY